MKYALNGTLLGFKKIKSDKLHVSALILQINICMLLCIKYVVTLISFVFRFTKIIYGVNILIKNQRICTSY